MVGDSTVIFRERIPILEFVFLLFNNRALSLNKERVLFRYRAILLRNAIHVFMQIYEQAPQV